VPAAKGSKAAKAAAAAESAEDQQPIVAPAVAAKKASRAKTSAAAATAVETTAAPAASEPKKKRTTKAETAALAQAHADAAAAAASEPKKKRATKAKAAAATPEEQSAAAPAAKKASKPKATKKAPADDAAPAPAKKASKAAAKKAAAAATATATASNLDASASDTEEDAAGNTKAAPKTRVAKVKPPFYPAFGDLHVPAAERGYAREDFEEWRTKTRLCVDTATFTTWKPAKRAFYREIEALKHRKKQKKTQDASATAENHLSRLQGMNFADFAVLDGAWLSNYKVGGKFSAEELDKSGCPNDNAQCTFTVYTAAVYHGYQPLGIVSEETMVKPGDGASAEGVDAASDADAAKVRVYKETVAEGEPRVYVGCALPYLEEKKVKSPFAIIPEDRTWVKDATAEDNGANAVSA
jgi:hypothetical protein